MTQFSTNALSDAYMQTTQADATTAAGGNNNVQSTRPSFYQRGGHENDKSDIMIIRESKASTNMKDALSSNTSSYMTSHNHFASNKN